jgi:hypothetical protein
LWIEAAGQAAFVGEAAPGVPVAVRTAAPAVVELPPGARGAWACLDGASVGFVAGERLVLPACSAQLLVEAGAQPFAVTLALRPGEALSARAPDLRPARVRELPPGAGAMLAPWPARRFVAGDDGVVTLPAAARPMFVRIASPHGGDWWFDELWVEPGGRATPRGRGDAWLPIRVTDAAGVPLAGANVRTMRAGAGMPTLLAASTTGADGIARHRGCDDAARVVVRADGFATATADARDLRSDGGIAAMRLEPGHALRLVVLGEHSQALAGAFVTVGTDPATREHARTDGRGTLVVPCLPRGAVTLVIEHDGFQSLLADVEVPLARPREFVLARGASLRGKVVAADAGDLADVLVEVRERHLPHDPLPRRAQRVAAAADGSFVLQGLSGAPVDVFAHRVVRGVTSAGALRAVQPGGEPVTIPIRCDDPPPGSR